MTKEELLTKYDEVLTTDEMTAKYDVDSFAAPWVVVKRKSDGAMGTLEFQHSPRYYYAWAEHIV